MKELSDMRPWSRWTDGLSGIFGFFSSLFGDRAQKQTAYTQVLARHAQRLRKVPRYRSRYARIAARRRMTRESRRRNRAS